MSPVLRDVLGIAASYAFVFGFIGIATLLMRHGRMKPSTTRKVIHIGVAHWWLIAMATMNDPWVASIGPATFIIINAAAIRFRLLPAMDEGASGSNWGTVYFPITLLVLVNLCWRGVMPIWVGGIASLVLGWGDGLASVFGQTGRGPRIPLWGGSKSVAGTTAMFAASFVVVLVFTLLANPRFGTPLPAIGVSGLVAAAAAAVELVTPFGLDNLTVPLAVSALYAGVFV
jgi:phytol kinase